MPGEKLTTSSGEVKTNTSGVVMTSAPSSGPTTIDGFEDGDISEYSGDTSDFSVQTSKVFDGTYAMTISHSSKFTISSTSGLNSYPQAGDKFELYVAANTVSSGGGPYVLFGYQDSSNHYRIRMRGGGSGVAEAIDVISGGGATTLDSRSANPGFIERSTSNSGRWLKLVVTWASDGTITADFIDPVDDVTVVTLQGTDTSYTSGGFGWVSNNGNSKATDEHFYDKAEITGDGF